MPRPEPLRPDDPSAVGAYRILARLGEGGQGTVYLGQAPDGARVAVKVLREGDARLAKEIEAARRVEPFCVAQVLDASLGGRPYIVSEYVEGPSLQEAGRHAGADLQRLAVSTATALAAIHRAGIVHRDVKPANVLLGRDGPRVIDFGIARTAGAALTVTSGVVGTPAYMAPEQLAGEVVEPAADVFAWASMIVFAATGTPPFGDDSLPAVINRILHAEPWLGDVREPLRSTLHACLAKDPRARPAMEDVLLHLLGGSAGGRGEPLSGAGSGLGGTPVAGVGSPHQAADPGAGGVARRRVAPLVAGVAAVLAVGVSAVVVWQASSGGGAAGTTPVAHSTPRPSGHASGKTRTPERTGKPKGSPTAAGKRSRTVAPTRTRARRSVGPTRSATRTATSTPSRTRSTPTKSAPAKKARFSVAYVRVAGSGKIKDEGECYVGALGFGVGLDADMPGAAYTYRWLLDGQVIETGSGRLPAGSRSDYFGTKTQVTPSDGPHTVAFQVTAPGGVSGSKSFRMCRTAP